MYLVHAGAGGRLDRLLQALLLVVPLPEPRVRLGRQRALEEAVVRDGVNDLRLEVVSALTDLPPDLLAKLEESVGARKS